MKIIHCALWGDIEISDLALSIIDTLHFQRLHYIRQTGFSYKIFPTATTTRFAHSIGVYHITKCLLDHLILKQPHLLEEIENKVELICIAGLCHDLGHGPFSHWFDVLVEKMGDEENEWAHHEKRSTDIFRDLVIKNNVRLHTDQVNFICDLIENPKPQQHWYCNLINNPKSEIDLDKMDYLLRDCRACGLTMVFDPMRIIRNSLVIDNEWCFCDRIQDEIISLFQIRNRMYRDIYLHPTVQKFDQYMLQAILSNEMMIHPILTCLKTKNFEQFLKMDDSWILNSLPFRSHFETRQWNNFPEIILQEFKDKQLKLLENVRFYKRKNPLHSFTIEN